MRTLVCIFLLLGAVYGRKIASNTLRPVEPQPIEGCFYKGNFYPVGSFRPSNNDCMQCNCQDNGKVSCAIMDCARPPCSKPVKIPGQCCPVCKEILPDYPETYIA